MLRGTGGDMAGRDVLIDMSNDLLCRRGMEAALVGEERASAVGDSLPACVHVDVGGSGPVCAAHALSTAFAWVKMCSGTGHSFESPVSRSPRTASRLVSMTSRNDASSVGATARRTTMRSASASLMKSAMDFWSESQGV